VTQSFITRLKIAIGIPAYGGTISSEHARMTFELGNTLGASLERFDLRMFGCVDINPIDRARNTLVAQAMQLDCDWLFMIDADTWVESTSPDEDAGVQILRMISDADRKDAWIVCGAVVRRRERGDQPMDLMVYHQVMGSTKPDQLEPVPFVELGRRLDKIDACATACFAVNLTKLSGTEIMFKFTDDLSEDLDFCRQIRAVGGTIYVDGRVRTGHKSRSFALYNTASK
jgi:hypothetical protein